MSDSDQPIRVLLVDDHRIVRRGLTAYLSLVDDIVVVGEAGDGGQALDRIAVLEADGQPPDVVSRTQAALWAVRDGLESASPTDSERVGTGSITLSRPLALPSSMTVVRRTVASQNATRLAGPLPRSPDASTTADSSRSRPSSTS